MIKSFKEIYEQDRRSLKKSVAKPVDGNISINPRDDSTTTTQTVDSDTESTMIILDSDSPKTNTKTSILPVKESLTEEIKEEIKGVLTEHQEQSAMVLESVMKTNIKIKNSVANIVKSSAETNEKLVNDITMLIEKVEKLETKLSELQNLEIPAPIVDPRTPSITIIKTIHRDDNGLITHISETQTIDEDEDK